MHAGTNFSSYCFAVDIVTVPVWVYTVSVVVPLLLAGLILIVGIIVCRLHKRTIIINTSCIPDDKVSSYIIMYNIELNNLIHNILYTELEVNIYENLATEGEV